MENGVFGAVINSYRWGRGDVRSVGRHSGELKYPLHWKERVEGGSGWVLFVRERYAMMELRGPQSYVCEGELWENEDRVLNVGAFGAERLEFETCSTVQRDGISIRDIIEG